MNRMKITAMYVIMNVSESLSMLFRLISIPCSRIVFMVVWWLVVGSWLVGSCVFS